LEHKVSLLSGKAGRSEPRTYETIMAGLSVILSRKC